MSDHSQESLIMLQISIKFKYELQILVSCFNIFGYIENQIKESSEFY
jgi:hypothetical protein